MEQTIKLLLITIFITIGNSYCYSQCTETKDADMAKYKHLTETQDAQGCSQCAMLALYFCSATYSVNVEDKRKVSSLITACKRNITNMRQPYCCPELLNKQPQWGKNVNKANAGSQLSTGNGQNSSTEKNLTSNEKSNLNSTSATSTILNKLIQTLSSNPENPLNVNQDLLTQLANSTSNNNLKSKLSSYAQSFSSDPNLSMRQVYWDINKALNSFEGNTNLSSFKDVSDGLQILLEHPEQLLENIKLNIKNYKIGSFMNDPEFINSLANSMGSQKSAYNLAMGLDLAVSTYQALKEDREYKNDYTKYFEISRQTVYEEKSSVASKALVDAFINVNSDHMITPLYRYDFKSGASLRVENGILKFINPALNINKDLVAIEAKNIGKYPGNAFNRSQTSIPQLIKVSEDESTLYIGTGKVHGSVKCESCLNDKDGFFISSTNGEVLYSPKYIQMTLDDKGLFSSQFKSNEIQFNYQVKASKTRFYQCKINVTNKDYKCPNYFILDKDKKFNLGGTSKKTTGIYNAIRPWLIEFDIENHRAGLAWVIELKPGLHNDASIYSSSVLTIYGNSDKYENEDGMVNELTGLIRNKKGDLFIVNSRGGVGKLEAGSFKMSETSLANKIRASFINDLTVPYDYLIKNNYAFFGTYDENNRPPLLSITPDERWLVYTVHNTLCIINADNINDARSFELNFEISNQFYTVDDDELMLYVNGLDNFRFPITKKYSFSKLLLPKPETKNLQVNTTDQNDKKQVEPAASLADEIKKLKGLLDSGAITVEEYQRAKKKLLEDK